MDHIKVAKWTDQEGNDHHIQQDKTPCKKCGCRFFHVFPVEGRGWMAECAECHKSEWITGD